MHTKILLIVGIITILALNQKIEAQKRKTQGGTGIPISTNNGGGGTGLPGCACYFNTDTSGYEKLFCNTVTGADAAYCDSLSASGGLGVNYNVLTGFVGGYGGKQYVLGDLLFKNNSSVI